MSEPKIAVVHDWLDTVGGAERTLKEILACFPGADLYATVDFLPEPDRHVIHHKPVHTSFIQRLPRARSRFRNYLVLMPMAVEDFDLSAYDIVVSSSHAVAKGVLTGPHQLHVSYCYTPMRYAWHMPHVYLRESNMERGIRGAIARWVLHRMRLWDYRTAHGVDDFVAISGYIAGRIRKVYGRDAQVIYPPVDVAAGGFSEEKEDLYVTVGRITPYKGVVEIVEAFNRMPGRRLVVIGAGKLLPRVQALAGPNVSVLGYQAPEVVHDHLRRARAFVFGAEEDFGIAPVEAQSTGTPVIALGRGGALETVRGQGHPWPTGWFFEEASPEAICEAVEAFEAARARFVPAVCRDNAIRFREERFREELTSFVHERYETHLHRPAAPINALGE